jgi:hypothetical protein
MSFKGLYDSLMSLYRKKEHNEEAVIRLEMVLRQIEKIEREQRNSFVHNLWDIGDEGGNVQQLKVTARFNRGFHVEEKKYDVDEIAGFTKNLAECARELWLVYSERRAKEGKE